MQWLDRQVSCDPLPDIPLYPYALRPDIVLYPYARYLRAMLHQAYSVAPSHIQPHIYHFINNLENIIKNEELLSWEVMDRYIYALKSYDHFRVEIYYEWLTQADFGERADCVYIPLEDNQIHYMTSYGFECDESLYFAMKMYMTWGDEGPNYLTANFCNADNQEDMECESQGEEM